MAHIHIPHEDQLPGIRGLMAYSPETSRPMNALAHVLLYDENNSLSKGERELIATYTSYLNDCWFCQSAHGSAVQCYMDEDGSILAQVKQDFWQAPISDKLKTLLDIAASVQKGGKHVTSAQIEAAKAAEATDYEIHDTVLIAAAFCMFNRYVDGLGTIAPTDPAAHAQSGIRIKNEGYANFDPIKLMLNDDGAARAVMNACKKNSFNIQHSSLKTMPHITLPALPGIRSLAAYRPETGAPLYALAEVLLRYSSMNQADAELIATFTSSQNDCTFCTCSHAAAARYLFDQDKNVVDAVIADYETAPISDKMKALLAIAQCVQRDARTVSEAHVAQARLQGATDREIHDTVLIAATFCMFNRYVDGLATVKPENTADYEPMGERMATMGYVLPKPIA